MRGDDPVSARIEIEIARVAAPGREMTSQSGDALFIQREHRNGVVIAIRNVQSQARWVNADRGTRRNAAPFRRQAGAIRNQSQTTVVRLPGVRQDMGIQFAKDISPWQRRMKHHMTRTASGRSRGKRRIIVREGTIDNCVPPDLIRAQIADIESKTVRRDDGLMSMRIILPGGIDAFTLIADVVLARPEFALRGRKNGDAGIEIRSGANLPARQAGNVTTDAGTGGLGVYWKQTAARRAFVGVNVAGIFDVTGKRVQMRRAFIQRQIIGAENITNGRSQFQFPRGGIERANHNARAARPRKIEVWLGKRSKIDIDHLGLHVRCLHNVHLVGNPDYIHRTAREKNKFVYWTTLRQPRRLTLHETIHKGSLSPTVPNQQAAMGLFSKTPKPDPTIIVDGIEIVFQQGQFWRFTYRETEFLLFESRLIMPSKAELDEIVKAVESLKPEMRSRMQEGLQKWGGKLNDGESHSVILDQFAAEKTFGVEWSDGASWGDMGVEFIIKDQGIIDEFWGD